MPKADARPTTVAALHPTEHTEASLIWLRDVTTFLEVVAANAQRRLQKERGHNRADRSPVQ